MNEFACLNCGFPNIFYLHCKIRCLNCGFLLDCSDLDVGGEVQRAAVRSSKETLNPKRPPLAHNQRSDDQSN